MLSSINNRFVICLELILAFFFFLIMYHPSKVQLLSISLSQLHQFSCTPTVTLFSLSLSYIPTLSHTHTPSHTHPHTHTHTLPNTPPHTFTHTHPLLGNASHSLRYTLFLLLWRDEKRLKRRRKILLYVLHQHLRLSLPWRCQTISSVVASSVVNLLATRATEEGNPQ